MAAHSSTLAWKIPWTEEHGRLQSMGRKESDTNEQLRFHVDEILFLKPHGLEMADFIHLSNYSSSIHSTDI